MDVYLEGGNHLSRPMKNFLGRAAGQNIALNVLACRDGSRAIRLFGQTSSSDSLLLIDSEGDDINSLRQGVASRARVSGARDRVFFMVQLMEAWFLADRDCLRTYYGTSLQSRRLPNNRRPESVRKDDVLNRLRQATQGSPKGAYHKTDHAPEILEQLNPDAVYSACPNFALLIDHRREYTTA